MKEDASVWNETDVPVFNRVKYPLATEDELTVIEKEGKKEVSAQKRAAWSAYLNPIKEEHDTNPTNIYGNYITQGNKRVVGIYRVQYSYLLSSENRMKLIAGLQIRGQRFLEVNSFSSQIFVGISTTIWNRNYAF